MAVKLQIIVGPTPEVYQAWPEGARLTWVWIVCFSIHSIHVSYSFRKRCQEKLYEELEVVLNREGAQSGRPAFFYPVK
jgi:hypothetical protein